MHFLILVLLFISCTQPVKEKESLPETSEENRSISSPIPSAAESHTDTIIINTETKRPGYINVSVYLKKGDSFSLRIPEGYSISVAAEGLKRPRFLAMSPDKRLFVTDMYDRSDNKRGRVLIFNEWDEVSEKFTSVSTYLDNLHNPNQVQFYNGYIYIAETGKLIRYKFTKGDTIPSGKAEVIATFPDHGLSYKYGGWHLTRSIAFHNNKLYVSVGSSCNACIEKEDMRAVILEMDADGKNSKIFARGLRNTVGIKWIGNTLWGTGMGRDLIGPDKPEDVLQQIARDGYYGWPFYFQYKGRIYADVQFKDSVRTSWVKEPPVASVGFLAHSAPLGLEYMAGFTDPFLRNSILVCLHGSTSVWRQRGNSIVKAGRGNRYVEVVSGFLSGKTEKERYGRPCDILMTGDTAFYFTDDHNGVLYYVSRKKEL